MLSSTESRDCDIAPLQGFDVSSTYRFTNLPFFGNVAFASIHVLFQLSTTQLMNLTSTMLSPNGATYVSPGSGAIATQPWDITISRSQKPRRGDIRALKHIDSAPFRASTFF